MIHKPPSRRYKLSLILGLILISVLVLAPFTIRFRHCDEGIFIHTSLRMLKGEKLYADLPQAFDPLPFLTLKWIFSVLGQSFLALRFVFIAMIVATVLLIYWIGRSAGLSYPLAAGSAFLLLLSVPPFFSYSHHWQSTFLAVAAVALFMAAEQRKSKVLFFCAGLVNGLVFHSHLSKGIFMAGICALWLILIIASSPKENRFQRLSLSIWWLLGMFLSLASIPLWFYLSGLWPDYWHNVIGRKISYGHNHIGRFPYWRTSVSDMPFAELVKSPIHFSVYIQQSLMLLLPIIVVAGALYQIIQKRHTRRRLLNPGNFLILSALGLCLSLFYSPAPYKIPTVMGLVFPALALIAQRSSTRSWSGTRRAWLLLGFCIIIYGVKTAGMVWVSLFDRAPTIQTQLGPVSVPDQNSAREIVLITKYFQSQGRNNCAFVYPHSPYLYFFCGLSNPTSYSTAQCSSYTNLQDEEKIQEQLNQHSDCKIVLISKSWGSSPEMISWIHQNYNKEKIFGEFEVWGRSVY